MKNKTLNKEEILSRLEKSNPEQLEARLEMKSESSSAGRPREVRYADKYPIGTSAPADSGQLGYTHCRAIDIRGAGDFSGRCHLK